jgi:hypothetical protein
MSSNQQPYHVTLCDPGPLTVEAEARQSLIKADLISGRARLVPGRLRVAIKDKRCDRCGAEVASVNSDGLCALCEAWKQRQDRAADVDDPRADWRMRFA